MPFRFILPEIMMVTWHRIHHRHLLGLGSEEKQVFILVLLEE